ncbi:coenzyme PQQ synthesis protein D [bacterium BMS3Abin01]|nr:coenzyme PQQ synthesis protein D [bacterium BMS3Abin01]
MSGLGPATRVQHSVDAVSREVDGQLVILTPTEGTLHELDELAALVWSLCAEPVAVEEITDRIVDEYNVDRAVAQEDLVSFLVRMIDIGALSKR